MEVFVLLFAKVNKKKIIKRILDETSKHKGIFQNKSFENIIEKELSKLEFGLHTIKIIASIAPLLGLLGTVIGVLNSFDSISKLGLGDPTIFSTGISVALITTIAGITVSIPHHIAYNYLIASLDKIENRLESEVLNRL